MLEFGAKVDPAYEALVQACLADRQMHLSVLPCCLSSVILQDPADLTVTSNILQTPGPLVHTGVWWRGSVAVGVAREKGRERLQTGAPWGSW